MKIIIRRLSFTIVIVLQCHRFVSLRYIFCAAVSALVGVQFFKFLPTRSPSVPAYNNNSLFPGPLFSAHTSRELKTTQCIR